MGHRRSHPHGHRRSDHRLWRAARLCLDDAGGLGRGGPLHPVASSQIFPHCVPCCGWCCENASRWSRGPHCQQSGLSAGWTAIRALAQVPRIPFCCLTTCAGTYPRAGAAVWIARPCRRCPSRRPHAPSRRPLDPMTNPKEQRYWGPPRAPANCGDGRASPRFASCEHPIQVPVHQTRPCHPGCSCLD